jgi:hypothetical protein
LVLKRYLDALAPSSWFTLDLYTNDHTPGPGDLYSDYTIVSTADWPGYVGWMLPAGSWSSPAVVDSVATTHQDDPAVFVFPPGLTSVTVYGYLVTDGYLNLMWAESFDAPIVAQYPGTIQVQPYFNIGIQEEPSAEVLRARAGFVDDDSDGEEEG